MGDARWLGREIDPRGSTEYLEEALDRLFQADVDGRAVSMLEVGCGDGRASRIVFERLVQAYGRSAAQLFVLDLDMSKTIEVSHCLQGESFRRLRVLRGDMYRLPFTAAGFDFVVALNIFFWAERQRLLAEAARVLKPGGSMLICDLLPRPSDMKRPLMTLLLGREQILGASAAGVSSGQRRA